MIPKVTVLMSIHNGQQYLKEAVDSILHQTLTDFEFIIIDDGSTDKSYDILVNYAEQDQRISLIRNENNIGLTRSLNIGLSLAQGEYVARQDHDDISFPHRLEKEVEVLDNHSEVVLISCDCEVIDSGGFHLETMENSKKESLIEWYLLFHNYVGPHSTVMFRREPVSELGGYSENLRYAQDYDLWLRLANLGKISILPEVLLQWRQHAQCISEKFSAQQTSYALNIAQSNIQQLTGIRFSLNHIAALRNFWLGFPLDVQQIPIIDSDLRIIANAFLVRHSRENRVDPGLSRQLRTTISKWLLYCARSSNLGEMLWLKYKVLPFAFGWHPLGVIDYWLRIPPKVLTRGLKTAR